MMIELWSAAKTYLPFAGLGTFIIAEQTGFDLKDLLSTGPTAAALIIVVFAFLRRLDPMTRAVNKNTAVLMELRNAIGKDAKYSPREIARTEISAKQPSDD